MKILFTGGSSFTGYWFIRALSEAGHDVYATFTQSGEAQYQDIRRLRVRGSIANCTPVWNCKFGDEKFIKLLKDHSDWDLLCHHGAYVHDYKSLDFDYFEAARSNTNNIETVLPQLIDAGCNKLLLTGSVFEQNEGAGEQPLRAFSPYGLSKGLTADIFRYWTQHFNVRFSRFVIPNPFGPLEEKRFLTYLMGNWMNDQTARVTTPDYLRDNIHISLLAKVYSNFAEEVDAGTNRDQINPSGYVESQGAFAKRVAREMAPRIGKACKLDLAQQTSFDEPMKRVNLDRISPVSVSWDESKAWDDLAKYYMAI